MLSGRDVCEKLRVDRQQLNDWIANGLPWHGTTKRRKFEPAEVTEWLVAQGYAEEPTQPGAEPNYSPPAVIVTTIGEVASYFGKSISAVSKWLIQGMPGEPGRRGTREGRFDLLAIERWLSGRRGGDRDDSMRANQSRWYAAKAAMAELEFAEKRGGLVDADDMARWLARTFADMKAQLNQLPAMILRRLPPTTDIDARQRIRGDVLALLKRIYSNLQRVILGIADEIEMQKPEEGDHDDTANESGDESAD